VPLPAAGFQVASSAEKKAGKRGRAAPGVDEAGGTPSADKAEAKGRDAMAGGAVSGGVSSAKKAGQKRNEKEGRGRGQESRLSPSRSSPPPHHTDDDQQHHSATQQPAAAHTMAPALEKGRAPLSGGDAPGSGIASAGAQKAEKRKRAASLDGDDLETASGTSLAPEKKGRASSGGGVPLCNSGSMHGAAGSSRGAQSSRVSLGGGAPASASGNRGAQSSRVSLGGGAPASAGQSGIRGAQSSRTSIGGGAPASVGASGGRGAQSSSRAQGSRGAAEE